MPQGTDESIRGAPGFGRKVIAEIVVYRTEKMRQTMNIYESLRKDHDIQRELIDKLVQTQGDSEQRDELFKQVQTELKSHAAAEERHFCIPLMEHDMTLEQSRHGVAEHHEIDELLGKLENTDYSSPAWLTRRSSPVAMSWQAAR